VQQIANRLGAEWNYQHPSEVMDEIASLSPIFAGGKLSAPRRVQERAVARGSRWER